MHIPTQRQADRNGSSVPPESPERGYGGEDPPPPPDPPQGDPDYLAPEDDD